MTQTSRGSKNAFKKYTKRRVKPSSLRTKVRKFKLPEANPDKKSEIPKKSKTSPKLKEEKSEKKTSEKPQDSEEDLKKLEKEYDEFKNILNRKEERFKRIYKRKLHGHTKIIYKLWFDDDDAAMKKIRQILEDIYKDKKLTALEKIDTMNEFIEKLKSLQDFYDKSGSGMYTHTGIQNPDGTFRQAKDEEEIERFYIMPKAYEFIDEYNKK